MKRRREVLTWKEVVKRVKIVVPELTGAGVVATRALVYVLLYIKGV